MPGDNLGNYVLGKTLYLWPDGSLREEPWPPEDTPNDNGTFVVTKITNESVIELTDEKAKSQ